MKFILPRTILGNRGDIASRWGVLHALCMLGVEDVTVYTRSNEDIPSTSYQTAFYRPIRNLLPGNGHWKQLYEADIALWTVGLDMQDDSSLVKLMYLWTTFRLYRHLDLKTWCLFQGAGPLSTKLGRWLAGSVLREVDIFVARDLGTFTLINQISPGIKSVLAHDAIFLPGFENDLVLDNLDEQRNFGRIVARDDRPVIGFNIRQWFHFVSSILPYQFSQGMYKKRSKDKMFDLIQASISWIRLLRTRENVRVVLLSAYQPGVVPWEDDLPWLMEVKTAFRDDDEVLLIDKPMSMPLYYAVMSSLDLMIGMRLHSSLISLRFGVPSLNLSYTLKGRDILNHLGLPEYIVDLQTFMDNPEGLFNRVVSHLQNHDLEHEKVTQTVNRAIDQNMKILKSLLAADRF